MKYPVLNFEEYLVAKLAQGVSSFSECEKEFENIFNSQAERFYSAIAESPIEHFLFSYLTIPFQEYHHVFHIAGVLLEALKDDCLFEKVYSILCTMDPNIKGYLNEPTKKQGFEISVFSYAPIGIHGQKKQCVCFAISYIAYRTKNEAAVSSLIYKHVCHIIDCISDISNEENDNAKNKPSLSDILDELQIDKNEWKYIRSLTSADAISRLYYDSTLTEEDLKTISLQEKPVFQITDDDEIQSIYYTIETCRQIFLQYNIKFQELFLGKTITKEEQLKILTDTLPLFDMQGEYHAHDYVLGMILYLTTQELSNMRAYHAKHNEEATFLEKAKLKSENIELKTQNQKLSAQLSNALSEIERLKKHLLATDYQNTKESGEYIRELEKECLSLKAQIQKTKEDSKELESIREFLFQIRDETEQYLEVDNEVSCSITAGKKIIIVGGHINWRNNIKAAFPDIQVYDGTNTSIDIKGFENADLVLFNTNNMSHSAYNRIITYAKQHKVSYAYLPRITSTKLLETELRRLFVNEDGVAKQKCSCIDENELPNNISGDDGDGSR